MVFMVGKGVTNIYSQDLVAMHTHTRDSLRCMWYRSEEFTQESRQQSLKLSISLLKNSKKGNDINLPNPSESLV